MAMRRRLVHGAADGYIHGEKASGSKVRIEAGKQFEVEMSVRRDIKRTVARKLNGAVSSQVSSLPHQMELLEVERLIGEREANGILITQFNVFGVQENGSQVALESPLPGLVKWAAHVERASDCGMSCELASEVGAPQGVEIELVHFEVEVGGIVTAQLDVAADRQRAPREAGIAGEMQFAALGHTVQVEVTRQFVIEREVPDVDVRVDDGYVGSAGSFEHEIGSAFNRDAIGVDSPDAREVKVVTCKVKLEGAGGRIVRSTSDDDRIVVEEVQIVERDFAVGDVESGIELLDGLTVSGSVFEMDLPLAVRFGESARSLEDKIGLAGYGIVEAGEGFELGQVGIVDVRAQVKRSVPRYMTVLERGGGIKFRGGIVSLEGSSLKSDRTERKLDGSGERIPVGFEGK